MRRTIGILLALALIVGGVASWHYGLVDRWLDRDQPSPGADPVTVAAPDGLDLPPVTSPPQVAAAVRSGALSAAAVRKALAPYLADPDLGRHVLAAVAPLTGGRPLVEEGSGTAVPASTTKLVTTTAALLALGPERTFETQVLRAGPRRVVLVGGGDPFLEAAQPDEGADTDDTDDGPPYPPRADVADLAAQTAKKLKARGVRQVRVEYDAGLFTGPSASPQWEPDYVPDGVVSPVTALWVDQGRSPTGFGRVADPALTAATAFATALAAAGVKVTGAPTPGTAPESADQVASVSSAPLGEIVEQVLQVSDNEASEVLLRHVGIAAGGEASFAGGRRGVVRTLKAAGVDLTGATLYDGSGLSRRNSMTPGVLLDVLRLATTRPELGSVVSGLPVAGFTGSLALRFEDAPAEGRGRVRAKTGTLTGVSSLAGVVTDLDGNPMLFVLMSDRVALVDTLDARDALDSAAAALGACHCGAAG
ncbi:MAG: D-alanyl-D-alanine carboxypeptidase/D-alanyl-D-alanine-endopeptidase [Nocardioides sp.]|jgi:D-alanyl-D-alanine carboxypeptidase/D-alanyl-D-alanine-endopeptidase (penicillin-binding protein 4)